MMLKDEWRRFRISLAHAWRGIRTLFAHEPNARIHLALAIIAIALAWLLRFSASEWILLLLTIGLVITSEAMNTAIEALTDLISPEYHPQAKIAKDVAAGAVLLSALTAIAVALLLFLPKLLAF
jgi:undecaprenol kinase